MMEPVGLKLEPLDTLFFRDGRPFDAASRVLGGLPHPQTLAGALRTALLARVGFDFARFARLRQRGGDLHEALRGSGAPDWVIATRLRGPWLARDGQPLLPQPAVLSRDKDGNWLRAAPLAPGELPGWTGEGRPLWRRGVADSKVKPGYLTLEGVARFLSHEKGLPEKGDFVPTEKLYKFDNRTGIAIDMATLTAGEGQIYGLRLLALERGVSLYAEVLPAAEHAEECRSLLGGALPFGGEGRYVRVEVLPQPCAWPQPVPGRGKSLWLLASPALVSGSDALRPGATLPGNGQARVAAAAAGSPLVLSGWDVARNGPRPTRFAVPAGAVYFVEGDYRPPDLSLCAEDEARAEGWGFALQGAWEEG